ncbi:hypothetical protein L218DRAFT_953106 [Marasmius fiardii PR-910]|nr:hypothetical protein L218DRAFT_953106 [Marasmius fiardii PR-910]
MQLMYAVQVAPNAEFQSPHLDISFLSIQYRTLAKPHKLKGSQESFPFLLAPFSVYAACSLTQLIIDYPPARSSLYEVSIGILPVTSFLVFNMGSLRVQFPHTQWPGWHVSEYLLKSSDSTSLSSTSHHFQLSSMTVSVDPNSETDYCSDSPVFRAVVLDSAKVGDGQVALKFAFRDDFVNDLAQEAQMYSSVLETLQGIAVPRCYGFFTGVGEEGQQVACLVLEYWGEILCQSFCTLSLDLRIRILERLNDLHRCGVHHGDFAERNVLTCGDDIRIIDFDQTVFHNCDCNTIFEFNPGNKQPDAEEFGCPMLWEICRYEMRIWEEIYDDQDSERLAKL